VDNLAYLLDGFATAAHPQYLAFAFLGVLLGTAVGVLPGIGPAMTVALLLPITYSLDPTAALITFAGIYYGGMYGGSTTSILLNTPGESSSMITALEGNKMAKRGKGAAALATAAIGSFVAGTIATALLTFLAPISADLAVKMGAVEKVSLMVLAFMTVGALLGNSVSRGLSALAVGMFIGLMGVDSLSGQMRFTFGLPVLTDGVDVVVVAVALFAVGEALYVGALLRRGPQEVIPVPEGWRTWLTRDDLRRSWKPWLRGTAIGFPFGTIPAGGAEIPTFLSYATEQRLAKGAARQEFGHGAIEGVAGPEAANNASAAGVLVPLLTLGIPTSATAAMMLVALNRYNINPGPLLFDDHPDLVWALLASLYIGNFLLLVLNLPLVGLWVKVLQIPRSFLYAGILVFAALGSFAVHFSRDDVLLLLVVGVVGFFMRRYGYPVAPLVVGLILGPVFENQARTALTISQGDFTTFVRSPFAVVVYAALLLMLVGSVVLKRRERALEEAIVTAEDPAELGGVRS
jgi:putative tricarboxylic transport membrane protein